MAMVTIVAILIGKIVVIEQVTVRLKFMLMIIVLVLVIVVTVLL